MSPNKATKKSNNEKNIYMHESKAKLGKKRGTVVFKCYMRSLLVIL